jgi:glucosamine-phosphate N-acetyltransferase
MPDVIIRQLREDDLFNGFLTSLDTLRKASYIERQKSIQVFNKIKSNPDHVIFVAEYENRVVGSTTLFLEPKFIHNGGIVGHIEDVVVQKDMQGKNIGEKLIRESLNYAKSKGCYKTILDCTDEVKAFYEKIGFKKTSNGMRYDHI